MALAHSVAFVFMTPELWALNCTVGITWLDAKSLRWMREEWTAPIKLSQDVWLLLSLCFIAAPHAPGCHSVQPQTLKLLHQVQTENVSSSLFVRWWASTFVFCCGAWRLCTVVHILVGIRTGWDATLLQQLHESQWWRGYTCCGGCGGGGPASQAKVLWVGWRWSAHELTVPTRWHAERVKAANRRK